MYTQKGSAQGLIIGIIALLVLGGGAFWAVNSQKSSTTGDSMQKEDSAMEKTDDVMMQKEGDSMMMKEDDTSISMQGEGMENDGTMMQKDSGSMMEGEAMQKTEDTGAMEERATASYTGTVLQSGASPFIEFNQSDYELSQKNGDVALLWYYANWCPTCRVEQGSIEAAVSEFDKSGIVVFRVNINDSDTSDAEVATAREFGVAFRHTKVAVQNNQRVLKTTETWNKGHYLEQFQALLN